MPAVYQFEFVRSSYIKEEERMIHGTLCKMAQIPRASALDSLWRESLPERFMVGRRNIHRYGLLRTAPSGAFKTAEETVIAAPHRGRSHLSGLYLQQCLTTLHRNSRFPSRAGSVRPHPSSFIRHFSLRHSPQQCRAMWIGTK